MSIHTLAEQTFVHKIATSDAWIGNIKYNIIICCTRKHEILQKQLHHIGARDFVHEGTFTWSDGSSNAFASTEKTVWGGTLPGTTSTEYKDWVYITSGGTWTQSTGLSTDVK